MKTAKVIGLMKQRKIIKLYQSEDTVGGKVYHTGPQWISDGAGFYCLDGMPKIEEPEQFFAAYDVREKQQRDYQIDFQPLPPWLYNLERYQGSEDATPQGISVAYPGMPQMKGFRYGADGLLLIAEKYLIPFSGEPDDYLAFVVRNAPIIGRFLCVYDGLDIKAVILPIKFHPGNADLIAELGDFQREICSQSASAAPVMEAAKQKEVLEWND